jgi:NADH-quinone oxidoreductase subunit J
MSDRAEVVVFWIFAIPLLVSAIGVVVARNPVSAAMSLVAAFFFLAGIYVLLTAHLLAFLQVLVYAGAIMVLFLFVIMLLTTGDENYARARVKAMQVAGVFGAAGVMAVVVRAVQELGPLPMRQVAQDFGTVKAVGRILFTQYLLPFEATSLLLLVAIVGAVVVAKQRI